MKIRSKIKSTTGLLGVAGLTMAGFVSACDQAEPTASLLQTSDDGACIIARVAEAHAATDHNMDAKPKEASKDACNPCAGANPCNPCAGANPCNPCAGANPCNPCNPCAGANPCNPCAGANPCNPCAGANPCNPCAGANPCNPCAGSADSPEMSGEEISAAYNCLKGEMKAGYGMSGENGASEYQEWENYNTQPYFSATHGGRLVNNYANATAAAYGQFEEAGILPVGSILAKDSLKISASGKATAGPLFLMEKMDAGFDPENGDWKYSLIMPNGTTWGVTGGKNSNGMNFCSDCHIAVEDYDYLFFLPDEYRKE